MSSGDDMKIGVKIFPEDLAYAKRIARYCDFFEVMAVPESNFRALKALGRPFTIHTIHSRWGFNPADPDKVKMNILGVETAKKAAEILHADTIVVHPGELETDKCSIENSIHFLSKLDSRFIVENMPASSGGLPHVGGSVEDILRIREKTRKGMCLDFPHAAEFAHQNHVYYIDFVKQLLSLKPRYFHISDTKIGTKTDMHLHLKEGDLNLNHFIDILPKDARIALETAHDFMKQHRDIALLRKNLD
jgi:endonuclease IV